MCSTAGEKQVEIYRLRAENAALKEQVAHLEESCISGFYYERVPQFSQGFPKHEVLELVTAKEVQAYVDKIEVLKSESVALVDALEQWKTSTQFHQVLFAEERLITNAALAAFKGEG